MNYLEILNEFVSGSTINKKLSKPFFNENYVCASDGHIGVLIPKVLIPDVKTEITEPYNLLKLALEVRGEEHTLDFTDKPQIPTEQIFKIESMDCPNCGGSGQCQCVDCDNEHDCGKCEGTGEIDKPGGKREFVEVAKSGSLVKLSSCEFYCDPDFILKIAKCFPQKAEFIYQTETSTLLIRFNDCMVLLMPKRNNGSDKIFTIETQKKALINA